MTSEVMGAPKTESDPRLTALDQLEPSLLGPKWLVPVRKSAIARYADAGFPTTKDEDWRFTNVKPIKELGFKPVCELGEIPDADKATSRSLIDGVDVERVKLVFVDGIFAPALSDSMQGVEGVLVSNLQGAFEQDPLHLQEHLSRYSQLDQNAFTALNTAYFVDGVVVKIGAKVALSQVVHLIFLASGKESGTAVHPRNLVSVEAGASVTIVEEYLGTSGEHPSFTNSVTEFVVGENAYVEHIKIQDEALDSFHVAGIYAQLDRSSRFRSHSLALGGRLSRNNIRTKLDGEGLECVLNGLYLTKGEQLADHHMIVEHAKPHCDSHEYFNGILDGRSKGVFHGRILVRQDAQKTDAKQTNKNLLLSDEATADSKPQLEIYADDVKCTHGATIGQMDEEAIFYLRARGVPHAVARRMLMHAFAGEIVERIESEPIRERLDEVVWQRLEE